MNLLSSFHSRSVSTKGDLTRQNSTVLFCGHKCIESNPVYTEFYRSPCRPSTFPQCRGHFLQNINFETVVVFRDRSLSYALVCLTSGQTHTHKVSICQVSTPKKEVKTYKNKCQASFSQAAQWKLIINQSITAHKWSHSQRWWKMNYEFAEASIFFFPQTSVIVNKMSPANIQLRPQGSIAHSLFWG